MTFYRVFNDHLVLNIRLTPGAKKPGIQGLHQVDDETYLKVGVSAIAEDNKANKALIALLSKELKIPKSRIEIIQGHTNRNKVVRVEGVLDLGVLYPYLLNTNFVVK